MVTLGTSAGLRQNSSNCAQLRICVFVFLYLCVSYLTFEISHLALMIPTLCSNVFQIRILSFNHSKVITILSIIIVVAFVVILGIVVVMITIPSLDARGGFGGARS